MWSGLDCTYILSKLAERYRTWRLMNFTTDYFISTFNVSITTVQLSPSTLSMSTLLCTSSSSSSSSSISTARHRTIPRRDQVRKKRGNPGKRKQNQNSIEHESGHEDDVGKKRWDLGDFIFLIFILFIPISFFIFIFIPVSFFIFFFIIVIPIGVRARVVGGIRGIGLVKLSVVVVVTIVGQSIS